MSKKHSKSSVLIQVTNGLFGGRAVITLREATGLITQGMAVPVRESVVVENDPARNSAPNYRFTAVRLTFAGYDKIVAGAAKKKAAGRKSAALERALHATDFAKNTIPSVQREELYQGSRERGTATPVTKVIPVLRRPISVHYMFDKTTGRFLGIPELADWDESFSSRSTAKFNPDMLPKPLASKPVHAALHA